MVTVTKKELIDRIAETTNSRRVQVKRVVQQFLDEIVNELEKATVWNFEISGCLKANLEKHAKHRIPRHCNRWRCPKKRTVKFKVGRLMKQQLGDLTGAHIDDEAGDVVEMAGGGADEDDDEIDEKE